MIQTIFNYLAILISLSTATGILVHDTHIDSATSVLALPSPLATYDTPNKLGNLGVDHTHVERQSFAQAVQGLGSAMPRIHTRTLEDKKHLLQKRVVRGHHAFDNYNLPIIP